MIVLENYNRKLQIRLGATPTTELDWTCGFIDDSTYGSNDGITNGTTLVDLAIGLYPVPPNVYVFGRRVVKYITVFNGDVTAQLVEIVFDNSISQRIELSITLDIGFTLHYDEDGWYVTDADGGRIETIISLVALPALADDKIWIGNGANVATAQALSGDLTVTNTGVTKLGITTTLGDLIYHNGSANTRLAGNTTAGLMVLTQTGTGAVSAAPVWQSLPVGGFLIYYFQNTASAVATYYKQLSTPYSPSTSLPAVAGLTTGTVVYNFITDPGFPNRTYIPSGLYQVNIHSYKSAGTKDLALYAEIWETTSAGVDIALIATTGTSTLLTGVSSDIYVTINIASNYTLASVNSRIDTRIKAVVTGGGSDPSCVINVGGTTDSRTSLPSNIVDATNFVPYTGATANVDLGSKDLTTTGVVTANKFNKVGITQPASGSTLTIADGKTLSVSDSTTLATNSITFAGTEVLTLAAAKNVTFADAFTTVGSFPLTATVGVASNITVFARETMGDANKVFTAGYTQVALTSALTAARTLTLPLANAFVAGTILRFADEIGGITYSNTITATRAGSDTINGATTQVMNVAYGVYEFVSDGSSKWTMINQVPSSSGTWSPTWAGFSADPTSVVATYTLVGKKCTVTISGTAGTSNATTFTVTMPFQSASSGTTYGLMMVQDNSAVQNGTGRITLSASSNTAIIGKVLSAAGGFTASGTKMIYGTFTYYVA